LRTDQDAMHHVTAEPSCWLCAVLTRLNVELTRRQRSRISEFIPCSFS